METVVIIITTLMRKDKGKTVAKSRSKIAQGVTA